MTSVPAFQTALKLFGDSCRLRLFLPCLRVQWWRRVRPIFACDLYVLSVCGAPWRFEIHASVLSLTNYYSECKGRERGEPRKNNHRKEEIANVGQRIAAWDDFIVRQWSSCVFQLYSCIAVICMTLHFHARHWTDWTYGISLWFSSSCTCAA